MLGPVFTADLRSHSRRPRVILLRITFLILLLCLFMLCYASLPMYFGKKQATILSDYASRFVNLYMIGQFIFLLIIGPAYVAGAIAEEKQRGTLDYLFASNLTNYEIVIGKYFSRLALLFQFVLAGLPILALVHLIGGVSLELMFGMLMGTTGCLASLTALTLLISVYSKNSRKALMVTALVAFILGCVWYLLLLLRNSTLLYSWFDSQVAPLVNNVLTHSLLLNPVYVSLLLRDELGKTGSIEGLPIKWYGVCLLQHLVLSALLLLIAIFTLRRRYHQQVEKTVSRNRLVHAYHKPPVWEDYPLYWKERYVSGSAWKWSAILLWWKQLSPPVKLFIFLGIISLVWILVIACFHVYVVARGNWLYGTPVFVICLIHFSLLVVGYLAAILRTASSVAVEKDRDTWDTLLASPVSIQDILLSRIYAGWLSARWYFVSSMIILIGFYILSPNPRSAYSSFGEPYGRSYLPLISYIVSNAGFLGFTIVLSAFFSLSSNSSIRNVLSALTVMIMLNLLPLIANTFFGRSNSVENLVAILMFLTDPRSIPVIVGLGLLAIFCVIAYYKMPRLRWLYDAVKWMGNMMALNAVLLLLMSGFTFAFGGYISFERMVLFVAPLMLDWAVLTEFLLSPGGYRFGYDSNSQSVALFQFSSGVLFVLMGLLLYWISIWRLQMKSERIDHSRLAMRHVRNAGKQLSSVKK